MKTLLVIASFITSMAVCSTLAATKAVSRSVRSEVEYLSVSVGHQSVQSITLAKKMVAEKLIHTLAFKNHNDQVVEQAIPNSWYNETVKTFTDLQKDFLKKNISALNYTCSSSLGVVTMKESHSFCRTMLSAEQNMKIDQWFVANKNLLLGKPTLR